MLLNSFAVSMCFSQSVRSSSEFTSKGVLQRVYLLENLNLILIFISRSVDLKNVPNAFFSSSLMLLLASSRLPVKTFRLITD